MRQAIETKYLAATGHRGSRVKATAQAGSVVLVWDDALDVNDNHRRAALALAEKYNWPTTDGRWVGGGNAAGTGNVYVWCVEPDAHDGGCF